MENISNLFVTYEQLIIAINFLNLPQTLGLSCIIFWTLPCVTLKIIDRRPLSFMINVIYYAFFGIIQSHIILFVMIAKYRWIVTCFLVMISIIQKCTQIDNINDKKSYGSFMYSLIQIIYL